MRTILASIALLLVARPAAAAAPADAATHPAFSLASSHIATSRERPAITLLFRQVSSLDFRVYRVNDPLEFFARLEDPHALGSETPLVPQEQTVLERIARWKAARRQEWLSFLRRQFSHAYRSARRESQSRAQVSLRQPLDYRQFARTPLLNRQQLVTSWRERLPMVRDTEARRIPLELPGEGVYVVEAVSAPFRAYTVVIVSDLGLVTKASPGQLLMFAADRFTGAPAGAGCPTEVIANRKVVATGRLSPDGLFEAAVPDTKPEDVVAVVRCGKQVAVTDPGSWMFQQSTREFAAYVYTDKPIYRPGHTVNLKAVLRWRQGDTLAPFDGQDVEIAVSDPNEKVVLRQRLSIDEFGAALATLTLPAGSALGHYVVRVVTGDAEAYGNFEVQEYRKPDFEVSVTPAQRFVLQGGKATATITARYYFGQPVANASVRYVVHRQPYYSPLRWMDADEDPESGPTWWFGGEEAQEGTARLDAKGMAEITIPLDPAREGEQESVRDYSARIEARVTDSSSREVSGSAIVHATVGRYMLVVRSERYAIDAGGEAAVTVRAIDYSGVAQPNVRIRATLERLAYDEDRGGPPKVTAVSAQDLEADADGRAIWRTTMPREAGSYRFRVEADADGRRVSDVAPVWVSGGATQFGDFGETTLELIPDKRSYQPGEVAHLALKGASSAAAMLVTKEALQVGWRQVLRPASSTLDVPIADGDVGDIYASVVFLKDDRFYRAETRLRVPATSRQLQVSVTADQPISKPRQPASFTVKVVDQQGRPVRAQVSLGVVDEAVYGVKADTTVDPLRFFYRREYSRVGTEFSREYSFLGYSGTQQLLLTQRRRPLTLADFKADRQPRPEVRKEFPDAIYWNGALVTGADGTARVQLSYPDALTTWRLTARAVTTDSRVGSVIARTTVTKDLIVRVITTRFLTEGDEVVVPTIVHNFLAGTKTVAVGLEAEGVSGATGQPGAGRQRVDVPEGGEARINTRFLANRPGTAKFTAAAETSGDSDAVELRVPVLPFGLKRSVGASGSLRGEGTASAVLAVPESANASGRAIRLSLAPSLAGPLLGALDFLTSYPYGCTEQTVSSFLPNLLVLRALEQLKLAPTERLKALDRQVSQGLARLYDYQHEDGGWGWWKTDENHPFMTAYAVFGLLEARAAGFKVEEGRTRSGARALEKQFNDYPRAVPDLKAYLAYVLTLAETRLPGSANAKAAVEQAWERREGMTAYGRALLLLSLQALEDQRAEEVAAGLTSDVQRKGDLAWWTVGQDPLLGDFGDTSVEATAFVVKALAARDPRSQLLEPAVRWLMLNRNFGTWWSSTKQTAMALYGLLDYMRARNETGADSSVEVLVNGSVAATARFTAASMTSPDPLTVLAAAAARDNRIEVRKKGGGTVYWSAAAEYYDKPDSPSGSIGLSGSRKLALTRRYFSLSPVTVKGRIVYRESPFSGDAAPGDLLLVRVDVAGTTDWRYLSLEDPLPAGVEPVRQSDYYELERPPDWWDGSRREYRDDKVVLFLEWFDRGHYQFVYLLKVTTPGVFRAMPAQVSPMYVPGTSAWSDSLTLTVTADPHPTRTSK